MTESDLLLVHADALAPVFEHAVSSASAGTDVPSTGYEDPAHLWDESREAGARSRRSDASRVA